MPRHSLLTVSAVLVAWLQSGCSGVLVVEDPGAFLQPCDTSAACGEGLVCGPDDTCIASTGSCSPERPSGDCPKGRICNNGACVCEDPADPECGCAGSQCSDPSFEWCDCDSDQGCIEGECVTITTANACDSDSPLGACPDGDVCVGQNCVPIEDDPLEEGFNVCTPTSPNGLCESGLACIDGFCLPIADKPCGPGQLDGYCPPGQLCLEVGGSIECQTTACSPQVPTGACGVDQFCTVGVCELVPCGPNHLEGGCDNAEICSQIGECIDEDSCKVTADCDDASLFCSESESCLGLGSCVSDLDCESQPLLGQGFACDNGFCIERLTCSIDTDCRENKFCSEEGNCLDPDSCDDPLDCAHSTLCTTVSCTCSVQGVCIPDSGCLEDDDCTALANQFCSDNGTCIDNGTCGNSNDCPPSHICNGSSLCEVGGDLCDPSASFVTVGCDPGDLRCCDTGNPGDCCDPPTPNPSNVSPRCSSAGSCIQLGECVTNSDCFEPHMQCNSEFQCEPAPAEACPANVCGRGRTLQFCWGLHSGGSLRPSFRLWLRAQMQRRLDLRG